VWVSVTLSLVLAYDRQPRSLKPRPHLDLIISEPPLYPRDSDKLNYTMVTCSAVRTVHMLILIQPVSVVDSIAIFDAFLSSKLM
jgi:hypothetical protein